MNYQEAIEYLQSLPDTERAPLSNRGTFMSLESMKTLLKYMGNPHKAARTIHVTGSKGKGSTSTFITSILKSAGYRTALFTSPHIRNYRERFAFDLEPISEQAFAEGVAELKALFNKNSQLSALNISTFGFLTALFFYCVSKASPKIDWQIVEVGLGGTTDATNVFINKDAAVITAISLEHTAILGQTVREIATNKAGIITPGCTTVLAPQRDPIVNEVVRAICHERKSVLIDVAELYKSEPISTSYSGQQFAIDHAEKRDIYHLHMLGAHQIENATTALATINAVQNHSECRERDTDSHSIAVKESMLRAGLDNVSLPGRFEILNLEQPKIATIILDCAHNQDSARSLVNTIKETFPSRRCIFVVGVNQDKQIEAIYAELRKINKTFIATVANNPRAMATSEISSRLTKNDPELNIVCQSNIADALSASFELCAAEDLICVTGSFYLVAEVRELLHSDSKRLASKEEPRWSML